MKDSSRTKGDETWRITVLNPIRLVQEVAAEFRLAAERKALGLELEPCSDWHDVVGDQPKVREILSHLLANAFTSTSTGRVQLAVKPPDGQHWGIVVQDTGCGMTSEETSLLRESFSGTASTSDSSAARSGLRTVKELVEQLQGKISVRSVIGQGTRIEVRLPVMIREPDAPPATESTNLGLPPEPQSGHPHESGSVNKSLRLLVVEDHDDLRAMLGTFFEGLGHRARIVADVASAMQVAGEEPFDVLLSDIALPDGDGWELLARLEQSGRRPRYAIAMSGFYGLAGYARSKEAGFAVHLVKPFPPANLTMALDGAGLAVTAGDQSGRA